MPVVPPDIVPFEPAHHGAALALWRRCEGIGLSRADEADAIAGFLQRNPGTSFAAFDGARLVGTILVGHDGRRGLIHHLAVEPAARGRGLARQLVRHGLQALRACGIGKCHLLVQADNASARRFWQAVQAEHRQTLVVYSLSLDGPA